MIVNNQLWQNKNKERKNMMSNDYLSEEEVKTIEIANAKLINAFIDDMIESGLSDKTINQQKSALDFLLAILPFHIMMKHT